MFTKTQLFDVFITKKLALGNKFALTFDEAIKEENNLSLLKQINNNNSPKLTIKQLSKRKLLFFRI